MASQLGLYNSALHKIKQRRIASLVATDPARYELDAEYNDTVTWMLEQADWNFADKSVAINHSDDLSPLYGFSYAFEVPDDFLRLTGISANGIMQPPLLAGEFKYERVASDASSVMTWFANCDPLYVSYISSDALWGFNLGGWTASFADACAYELGWRIAPQVTNWSATEKADYRTDKRRALFRASNKDARNQAAQTVPVGQMLRSRVGSRSDLLRNR